MWFGYMNRNYEEELDVPVGPDNHFEPGVDRGQPTHFIVRRHKDVFKVVVPKDFGDQKLEWALTAHGQTAKVSGTLKPVWMIDRLRTTRGGNSEKIDSNTPPHVVVQPFEASIVEPGSVTFNLLATDDGLPERRLRRPQVERLLREHQVTVLVDLAVRHHQLSLLRSVGAQRGRRSFGGLNRGSPA